MCVSVSLYFGNTLSRLVKRFVGKSTIALFIGYLSNSMETNDLNLNFNLSLNTFKL
jgi:hypothetical protein